MGDIMKNHLLFVAISSLGLVACGTTKPIKQASTAITPPQVVKSPDFRHLPTKSCKNGEFIHTSAILALDKQGQVTGVSGLTVKDKELALHITQAFKKAKYTPYLIHGKPVARNLDVAISLKCPTKSRR